jgi:hypothetical protein
METKIQELTHALEVDSDGSKVGELEERIQELL